MTERYDDDAVCPNCKQVGAKDGVYRCNSYDDYQSDKCKLFVFERKKYAVFAGDKCYPCGGFNDLKGRFETLEEAREYATTHVYYGSHYEWWHIVDTATFTIVARD